MLCESGPMTRVCRKQRQCAKRRDFLTQARSNVFPGPARSEALHGSLCELMFLVFVEILAWRKEKAVVEHVVKPGPSVD